MKITFLTLLPIKIPLQNQQNKAKAKSQNKARMRKYLLCLIRSIRSMKEAVSLRSKA
jgi:hypothetical protein